MLYSVGDLVRFEGKGRVEHNRFGEILGICTYYSQVDEFERFIEHSPIFEKEIFEELKNNLNITFEGDSIYVHSPLKNKVDHYKIKQTNYLIELQKPFKRQNHVAEIYEFDSENSNIDIQFVCNKNNSKKHIKSLKYHLIYFYKWLNLFLIGEANLVFKILPADFGVEKSLYGLKRLVEFRDHYIPKNTNSLND